MELSVTASFQTDSVPSAHMGDTVVDEQSQDAVLECYAEVAQLIESWLPSLPFGVERDELARALRHLRAAASIPPLRLLD